jgi:predicted O-linked N-acetylglucosamine transferase (SPINDLY family)
MRGRHTVAMLEQMEIPELIAADRSDYVSISVRLLKDPDFYQEIRERIQECKARLFHDRSVAEAFQVAVETICRTRPQVGQQPAQVIALPSGGGGLTPAMVV